MLLAQYIVWPKLEGSGKDWIFAFHTFALLWKDMRFFWSRILKLLMLSLVPLNMKQALTLRFLVAGVPYVSHLLKLEISSRALPLVQESPFDPRQGARDLMLLVENDMEVPPLILL